MFDKKVSKQSSGKNQEKISKAQSLFEGNAAAWNRSATAIVTCASILTTLRIGRYRIAASCQRCLTYVTSATFWARVRGAGDISSLLRSRAPAADHIWERLCRDIYVLAIHKGAIAHVMIIAGPSVSIRIVWAQNYMPITSQPNHITVVALVSKCCRLRISRWLANKIGSCAKITTEWFVFAQCRCSTVTPLTHILFNARWPVLVMQLTISIRVRKTYVQGADFTFHSICVVGCEWVVNVGARKSYATSLGEIIASPCTLFTCV